MITDAAIDAFIAERKPLMGNFQLITQFRNKLGHQEAEFHLTGAAGSEFQIRVRQARLSILDFSVILLVRTPTRWFRLRRYNGRSHEHTNRIERQRFYSFHIHRATERYQLIGADEDGYAEPTDRYSDVRGALDCLVLDAAFDGTLGPPMLPF